MPVFSNSLTSSPVIKIARDHEEDVHADVAARRERHPGMVEQDRADGHGPEALHVGTEPLLRRLRVRLGRRSVGGVGWPVRGDGTTKGAPERREGTRPRR